MEKYSRVLVYYLGGPSSLSPSQTPIPLSGATSNIASSVNSSPPPSEERMNQEDPPPGWFIVACVPCPAH